MSFFQTYTIGDSVGIKRKDSVTLPAQKQTDMKHTV